jgi:hypothetical protein
MYSRALGTAHSSLSRRPHACKFVVSGCRFCREPLPPYCSVWDKGALAVHIHIATDGLFTCMPAQQQPTDRLRRPCTTTSLSRPSACLVTSRHIGSADACGYVTPQRKRIRGCIIPAGAVPDMGDMTCCHPTPLTPPPRTASLWFRALSNGRCSSARWRRPSHSRSGAMPPSSWTNWKVRMHAERALRYCV